MATVIVFGDEKGGTGKSTLAIHIAVALVRQGLTVAAIDADVNQGSLTRYFENRTAFVQAHAKTSLASPTLVDAAGWVGGFVIAGVVVGEAERLFAAEGAFAVRVSVVVAAIVGVELRTQVETSGERETEEWEAQGCRLHR